MHSGDHPSLAQWLRSATHALHAQVERSGVMQSLLRGRIDRISYCLLLRNLHALYAALEAGLARHAGDPRIAPVLLPGIARATALAEDLAALHGSGWAQTLPLMPAAQAYAQRLRQLAADAPELLVAHAYVRYLGDLSGGQVLRRIVARSLDLTDAAGTHFYAFGDPDDAAAMARQFRAGLDTAVRGRAAQAALVAEACWGFTEHGRLFAEIERGAVPHPAS